MNGASGKPIPGVVRRDFLRRVLAWLAFPLVVAWDQMLRRASALPETSQRTVSVPLPVTEGLHVYPEVIVVNRGGGLTVFSSACPHLGCRIDRVEAGHLACPCHGSRFALDGAVTHGPAARDLHALPYTVDRTRAVIRVRLEA